MTAIDQSSIGTLTAEQRRTLFEQFLSCIEREGNLAHYRQLWGMQWNVACFAAFFVLQNSPLGPVYKAIAEIAIAMSGSAASILSFIGIRAAHKQAEYLIKKLNEKLNVSNHDWDETEFIRPYGDPKYVHGPARRIAVGFPFLLMAFWILVFLYALAAICAATH